MYQTELEALNALNDKLQIVIDNGFDNTSDASLHIFNLLNSQNELFLKYIPYLEWVAILLILCLLFGVIFKND